MASRFDLFVCVRSDVDNPFRFPFLELPSEFSLWMPVFKRYLSSKLSSSHTLGFVLLVCLCFLSPQRLSGLQDMFWFLIFFNSSSNREADDKQGTAT